MDAQASIRTPDNERGVLAAFMVLFVTMWSHARALALAGPANLLRMDPQQVGRSFRADMGASSDPVKDLAIGFILLGVSLLIVFAFWPVITAGVATAQADTNTTGATSTILGLIPLLLAVSVLAVSVSFMVKGFKGIKG